MINRLSILIFILFSGPLNAQMENDMDAFQKYLTRNIEIKNRVSLQGRGDNYEQIICGGKTYYFYSLLGAEGCNGTFCIEQEWNLYNDKFTDSTIFWSWGYMGFFSDVNNDKRLDFIDIIETGKHIYYEDTFRVEIQSLIGDSLKLDKLKDQNGKEYFISIYWKGGMFGENSSYQPIKIIDQYWPFYVKF